jgi:hypothetical protein
MPRKPRVDPPPLDSFQIEVNGQNYIFETRDGACIVKSAGYINRELFSARLWDQIMPRVLADYLDLKGRKVVPSSKDYLANPNRFANKMAQLGLNFSGDLTSLRKDYYPRVLKELQIFENAIKSKKQS